MGSRAKQSKYIDLHQFPHDKQGRISWKNSVGIIANFFYNGKEHTIEILEYNPLNQNMNVKIDDMVIKNVNQGTVKKLRFEKLFYCPNYFYNVGDIINNLLIIEQIQIVNNNSGHKEKGYICKCLNDGYIMEKEEQLLHRGYGCPVCDNKIVVRGINDVGTTNPELVCYFEDINDVYTHTIGSNDTVSVKCKYCGEVDNMTVFELNRRREFVCNNCSDNISYPNKFAHELFNQLKNQYLEYKAEYAPKWSDRCRYDNYIKLLNGREILVEMDGAFHYSKYEKFSSKNDAKKEVLALNNGMNVIHINCNYSNIKNRFEYVKLNTMEMLKDYFDLSNIDWYLCDKAGLSNMMETVINYFNENINCSVKNIAKHFNLAMSTVYEYLKIGNELGMCKYIKNDPNRSERKLLLV